MTSKNFGSYSRISVTDETKPKKSWVVGAINKNELMDPELAKNERYGDLRRRAESGNFKVQIVY